MKTVRNLQYFWHEMRSNYYCGIANDCLDRKLKAQLLAKSDYHKLEANQCRTKLQNVAC